MKPETAIVHRIMNRLEAEGGFWVKIHGSPFQLSGIPDILGCWKGLFIAIEVKCVGNAPTRIQQNVIELIAKAGGRVGVAYNVAEALAIRDNT